MKTDIDNLKPPYLLRFYFDHVGECLWPANDAAWNKFHDQPIDTYVEDEQVEYPDQSIKVSRELKNKMQYLDSCFSIKICGTRNKTDIYNSSERNHFYLETKKLYNELCEYLGEDYIILYGHENEDIE